jgi:putative transcriptional regulator
VTQLSGPEIRAIRQGLGMSQRRFAERFALGLWSLRRWEQGAKRPPRTVELLLTLIGRDPNVVDRAVADCRPNWRPPASKPSRSGRDP